MIKSINSTTPHRLITHKHVFSVNDFSSAQEAALQECLSQSLDVFRRPQSYWDLDVFS